MPEFMLQAISEFFGHPIVTAIAVLASIISIPLSFYFYRAAKIEPRLCFALFPWNHVFVRAERLDDVSVSFKGVPVTPPLTTALIMFWNDGKAPVRGKDILTPIEFRLKTSGTILEVSLLRTSRPETKLAVDAEKLSEHKLSVTWDILEHRDGGSIHILFSESEEIEVRCTGCVIGQREVARQEWKDGYLVRDLFPIFLWISLAVFAATSGILVVAHQTTVKWWSMIGVSLVCLVILRSVASKSKLVILRDSIPSFPHVASARLTKETER